MKPHQQSQKEHGGDRMKTRAHQEVERLLGREVEYGLVPVTDTSNDAKCADCKQPAKYLIVEKGLDENIPKFSSDTYYKAWYYCGVCEVG